VKVLNGGWRKWIKEGRPISLDSISRPPNAKFTPKVDESLFVSTDRLKQVYDEPDVVVWDVRTKEEYTGENSRHNARPGHIPGATHLEWVELMDSETHTFKPPDEMRRILESKGITPDKEVLAH
jgi:thiosulfate/3-mercaptopyruvate sulfurtransferase